jgi:hypothetical protein
MDRLEAENAALKAEVVRLASYNKQSVKLRFAISNFVKLVKNKFAF